MKASVLVALIAASTTVVHYRAATMHVAHTVQGSCWTGSIASNRSDAFRCMAGNQIHDPCFVLTKISLACPVDLAANSGIAIRLTEALPVPQPSPKQPQAWALLLQGGESCNRATGTLEDPSFPFYCAGHPGACGVDLSTPRTAYFARCATFERRKATHLTSTLVRTVYE